MWQMWIQIVPVLVMLALGLFTGTIVERRHFRRLDKREQEVSDIFLTNLKTSHTSGPAVSLGMVVGEVVIASDYFKSFAARLRNLIGGRVKTFETLMERARREAILRMLESAKQMGANQVINLRLATSDIGSGRRRRPSAMVEMYAYGTALRVDDDPIRKVS